MRDPRDLTSPNIFQVGQLEALSSQAVAVSLKSVARIENNYIYKTGTGVSIHNSDASCLRSAGGGGGGKSLTKNISLTGI